MFDTTEADAREESIASLVMFAIYDSESWSEVALVAALRRDGSLTDEEKEAVKDLYLNGPNPAEMEIVETLVGQPFEHREVVDMLETCIQDGDYIGTIGFAKILNVTLGPEQINRVREAAEEAAEGGGDD